jgi:hypothetical protein
LHITEITQYLLNVADSTPEGIALRVAVERLVDAGDTDTLQRMALAACGAGLKADIETFKGLVPDAAEEN